MGQIISLNQVKLETLKVNIKTYLKTRFIRPSKSFLITPILFIKKLNNNFCLYVNY